MAVNEPTSNGLLIVLELHSRKIVPREESMDDRAKISAGLMVKLAIQIRCPALAYRVEFESLPVSLRCRSVSHFPSPHAGAQKSTYAHDFVQSDRIRAEHRAATPRWKVTSVDIDHIDVGCPQHITFIESTCALIDHSV